MGNYKANTINNKKIIHQLITFAVKHKRIMQNYLDETGVYQSQHRLLMEISRNPNASQRICTNNGCIRGDGGGIAEKT